MYYPMQIPYLLNEAFLENIDYQETVVPELSDFVICFWQMTSKKQQAKPAQNIIVADGCIDLIIDFEAEAVGFAGMRQTNFAFEINGDHRYLGARMRPGAFQQLTGLPGDAAMDQFVPLAQITSDFNANIFSLSMEAAVAELTQYFGKLIAGQTPNSYLTLFDRLYDAPSATVRQLCAQLGLSNRQVQRLFQMHYGLSPKMVLSVLRFQRCLSLLSTGQYAPRDALDVAHYYDDSHFQNDFKRNLGITPTELYRKYKA